MERKKFQKHQKEAIEEFAPKPSTSFESKLDKSKIRSQQGKEKENDDGYSVNEYDEDNSFKILVQKEKQRKERQFNTKLDTLSEKLDRHREKEEKTMALLKSMAAASGYL